MAVEQAHSWAQAAFTEAERAVALADEILASDDRDVIRTVADRLIRTADQLRVDAGYVRARVDREES